MQHLIVWRRGFTVLYTGQVVLTKDTRFSVEGERSILSISMVREEDTGEYVCQTTTIGGVIEQSHQLAVTGTTTHHLAMFYTCPAQLLPPSSPHTSTSSSQPGWARRSHSGAMLAGCHALTYTGTSQ